MNSPIPHYMEDIHLVQEPFVAELTEFDSKDIESIKFEVIFH